MKEPQAVALGRRGGLKGGRARADALSPWERTQIARRAANARWGNQPPEVNGELSGIMLMSDKAKGGGWDVDLVAWFGKNDSDPEVEHTRWAHGASWVMALANALVKLEEHVRENKPFRDAVS